MFQVILHRLEFAQKLGVEDFWGVDPNQDQIISSKLITEGVVIDENGVVTFEESFIRSIEIEMAHLRGKASNYQ